MKRIKKDKVKRGRIILSAILTIALALLSLGFGSYLGYVTLNINYVTIGTMTTAVGGLLVVAGFFIFFGCIGGTIALKELFIAHRNEEKFAAYKSSLYSAIVFYVIIAIISVIGIVSSFISYVPSNFTWGIIALGLLSLVLSAGCFYCVFKELKEHKKNKKKQEADKKAEENGSFNMNLSAGEIHKFSNMTQQNPSNNGSVSEQNQTGNTSSGNNVSFDEGSFERSVIDILKKNGHLKDLEQKEEVNFVSLAEKLMQLEELRKAGLINDQEYQELKRKCI